MGSANHVKQYPKRLWFYVLEKLACIAAMILCAVTLAMWLMPFGLRFNLEGILPAVRILLTVLVPVLATVAAWMRHSRYMTEPEFIVSTRVPPSRVRRYSRSEEEVINPDVANLARAGRPRLLRYFGRMLERSEPDEASRWHEASCISSYFMTLLLSPQSAITRITESVEPYSKSLHVESSYTFRIPHQLVGKPVVLPLLIQRRGELAESLKITDYHGNRIPSMSSEERDRFICTVIAHYVESVGLKEWYDSSPCEALVRKALDDRTGGDESCRRAEEACQALRDLFADGAGRVEGTEREKRVKRKALELAGLALESLLKGLGSSYPVCVRLIAIQDKFAKDITGRDSVAYNADPSRSMRISVEQRLLLERVRFRNKRGGGIAGKLFNRPMRLHFNLANADRAQSYHLALKGPENSYYADGSLRLRAVDVGQGDELNKPSASYFAVQGRYGQRHAHVNIRYGQGFAKYIFTFTYLERPPTSFQRAFISSLLGSMVLLCVCAPWLLGGQDVCDSGFAALTSCLSVVAAAGGWITTRSRVERGIQPAPWLSGVITVLTSCVALLAGVARLLPGASGLCSGPAEAMLVACVVQATNVFATLYACFVRGWIHSQLIQSPPTCWYGRNDPESEASYRKSVVQLQGGWFSGIHAGAWEDGLGEKSRIAQPRVRAK